MSGKESDHSYEEVRPNYAADPTAAEQPDCFGRYTRLEFLGQGGMAKVFRAYDPLLDRTVALKLLKIQDPELTSRFLQEAKVQARLTFPNVCQVYEVGEADGKKYIAMQYISGKTLRELRSRLTIREKARLIMQIAFALQAAHRAGLIHRDLKPVNVMVERNENGDLIPYVLDFGLSRFAGVAGITEPGTILGSPLYMSPEQARGEVERLDCRSDIYSLGVTFYELLTGFLPIEAQTHGHFLLTLQQGSTVPLRKRNPDLPADLEAIVMKCLALDPSARYQTAQDLGEDLKRFLNAEPVLVRSSRLYHFRMKLLKQRTALIAVLLLLCVFAVQNAHSKWRARERSALIHQYSDQAKEAQNILRIAYSLPLHDIGPDRRRVQRRIEQIETDLHRFTDAERGPVYFAIGQSYLALRQYEKARRYFILALKSGYHPPEFYYAAGIASGKLYEEHSEEAARLGDANIREKRQKEIKAQYKDPALRFLEKARMTATENRGAIDALIAFYKDNYDESIVKAEEAYRQSPWQYELKKLVGDIYRKRGWDADDETCLLDYERAGKAYEEAIASARSDPQLYEADCERWVNIQDWLTRTGSPEHSFQQAIVTCDKALASDSASWRAYSKQAKAYMYWAIYRSWNHQPNDEALRKVVEKAEKAVALHPNDWSALDDLGRSYLNQAENRPERFVEFIDLALKNFRRVAEIHPNFPNVRIRMSIAAYRKAEYLMERGLDPKESFKDATDYAKQSIAISPDFHFAHDNLGTVYSVQAQHHAMYGNDPSASLDLAISHYQRAIAIRPVDAFYFNVGDAYLTRAEFQQTGGNDPEAHLRLAQANLNTSLQNSPDFDDALAALGRSYLIQARYLLANQKDPAPALSEAAARYQAALHLNPDSPDALRGLTATYYLQAKHEVSRNKNPLKTTARAATILRKLPHNEFDSVKTKLLLAEGEILALQWTATQSKAPGASASEARALLDDVIKVNPRHPSVYEAYARLCYWEAVTKAGVKQEAIEEGLISAEKSLALNPISRGAHDIKERLLLLKKKS